MKIEEIIKKVKALNLPKGSYVLHGSCPLAAAGIREANDIDIFATPQVYEEKLKEGWKITHKGPNDEPVTNDIFEIHKQWNFSKHRPTLSQLLETATVIDGIAFASLEEIRKWKRWYKGAKHQKDIEMIDEHLNKNQR